MKYVCDLGKLKGDGGTIAFNESKVKFERQTINHATFFTFSSLNDNMFLSIYTRKVSAHILFEKSENASICTPASFVGPVMQHSLKIAVSFMVHHAARMQQWEP